MKKILFAACLLFTMFVVSCDSNRDQQSSTEATVGEQNDAMEDTTQNNNETGNDTDFAMFAADGGMLEERLGKLAQTNGSSAKVKELGKMMEKDHAMANTELKAWAGTYSVSLPTELSTAKQEKYNEFAAKKGADFDKAYAAFMVEEHEKVISEFTKEAGDGKNAELKSWAGSKLPALQHHLEMSKTTLDAVKK